MALPTQPVTLSVEQIKDLDEKLSGMRHDVAGFLSIIVAATELIRMKPERAREMVSMISEQPQKITQCVTAFSKEVNALLGLTKR